MKHQCMACPEQVRNLYATAKNLITHCQGLSLGHTTVGHIQRLAKAVAELEPIVAHHFENADLIPHSGKMLTPEQAAPLMAATPIVDRSQSAGGTYSIIVRVVVEGIHHWPTCNLSDVAFLKDPHRHLFHVEVELAVSHDDRDTEIIRMGRHIREILQPTQQPAQFGSMSCEAIARMLHQQLRDEGHNPIRIQVLEDGENGARYYPPA